MMGLGDLTKQLELLAKISKEMTETTNELNDQISTLTDMTKTLVEELQINTKSRQMVAKVCKLDQTE